MIQYRFSAKDPHKHLIEIEVAFDQCSGNSFEVQLPAWRPGRYELGNFAKNIQRFEAIDENENSLSFQKITKDKWIIASNGAKKIKLRYVYYAAELNAGSSYCDEVQLYVNPVNCCMYHPSRMNESIEIDLEIPHHFSLATSLEQKTKNKLVAGSFDELADSPFIASSQLQHHTFAVKNLPVHLWFCGECKPNLERITNDFKKFMQLQIELFDSCPAKEYHYLIQVLPYNFYHGVEHVNSTVLALGPGYALNDIRFNDLLGVSCHEFYHVWNIKTIRPTEMWPYDYTRENYFETGFVAEGVTTYMGDYLLWQSDVFNTVQFFNEMDNQIQKHQDNFGRFNHSVTQSGFDTWLDGYVPGVPDRKVSIYTEGCLLALITDLLIMKHSNCKNSLHDVMRSLYTNYYKKNKGYSYADYVKEVNACAGTDMQWLFDNYARQPKDLLGLLEETLNTVGIIVESTPCINLSESNYGFRLTEAPDKSLITAIHPDSPAAEKLVVNDQVISVNGYQVKNDANRWINYFTNEKIILGILRNSQLMQIELAPGEKIYYKNFHLVENPEATEEQKKQFNHWKNKR